MSNLRKPRYPPMTYYTDASKRVAVVVTARFTILSHSRRVLPAKLRQDRWPGPGAGPGLRADHSDLEVVPMSKSPLRVAIAGGGVAGLETLTALRGLAGGRVELTLIAPEDEFVYKPLTVEEPFAVGRMRQIALLDAARDANATFVPETVRAVDPHAKTVTTSESQSLEYDALVLALGAKPEPAVAHALTWDDRADAEMLGGLLRDVDEGYVKRLAVVIPCGPAWPLRAYELALFLTLHGRAMSADVEMTIVTPEPSPLALLGSRAVERVSTELDQAGITVVSADGVNVEPGHGATVILQPSDRRLEVDRVVALPALHGHPIAGIPADANGFVDADEHGRVPGLDDVWAAGDGTNFPLKSGGFAAAQADAVAEDIAAGAGAAVTPRPFDPTGHAEWAGLPDGSFLKASLGEGDNGGQSISLPAVGVPTLTYLQRDLAAGWRGHA